MTTPEQKLAQQLNEAQAIEDGLVRTLQSQIAMTPRGSYRSALESHLRETRDHSRRVKARAREIGGQGNRITAVAAVAQSVAGQALALAKSPLDLVRGGASGAEKVLKNARDAAASEALEIATYTSIEALARECGDTATARLAAAVRADEERMLERVLSEIPALTDAAVRAQIGDDDVFDPTTTGAADAARKVAGEARQTAKKATTRARQATRQARRVPGVTEAEGAVKGVVASADDLPIADYDKQTAQQIGDRLPGLSQVDLAKIETYERRHAKRTTVLERISSLRAGPPWPGYDEATAEEVVARLRDADEPLAKRVREYERGHKDRSTVLDATEREPSRT